MTTAPFSFQSWLDAYGRAWQTRDPEAAAALYTEDATYQVTPFLQPLRGRKAIFEYWSQVARTEVNVNFSYAILVATPALNVAKWSASFLIVPEELQTKLDGIFLISLDAQGRCTSLQEWWHKHQD